MKTKRNSKSKKLERLVRAAAKTIHPKNEPSLPYLAERAGFTNSALTAAIRRGSFTSGMASAIESVVGKDVLPREKLLTVTR